jgi:hypothetical protein
MVQPDVLVHFALYREDHSPIADLGAHMPGFRIFYVDGSAGHITGSHDFNAADDLDAIRLVEKYRTGSAMELWSGARKIKSWEATNLTNAVSSALDERPR